MDMAKQRSISMHINSERVIETAEEIKERTAMYSYVCKLLCIVVYLGNIE